HSSSQGRAARLTHDAEEPLLADAYEPFDSLGRVNAQVFGPVLLRCMRCAIFVAGDPLHRLREGRMRHYVERRFLNKPCKVFEYPCLGADADGSECIAQGIFGADASMH